VRGGAESKTGRGTTDSRHCYNPDTDQVVLVEGQVDAITFSEWDIPAIVIAGAHVSEELIEQLKKYRRVLVVLDNQLIRHSCKNIPSCPDWRDYLVLWCGVVTILCA
jgi:hypothetical protein